MTQTQALAKTSGRKELREWLQGESFKSQLAMALPKTISPERFVRIALTSTFRNPDLLKCTQESFMNCLLQLGAMGIEPDGRSAHLIPFRDKEEGTLVCTLIVDYKGIAEVLRRNHDVSSIHCDVVYTRDEYEAEQGTHQHLRHVRARGPRGERMLAYSFIRLPDGTQEFEEMTMDEVEAIRRRSKTPNKGPWVSDFDEMAKKTVFRRHSKTLPLSPETREVLEREGDGDALSEAERFAHAEPVRSATVLGESGRKRPNMPEKAPEPTQELAEAPAGVEVADMGMSAPETPSAASYAGALDARVSAAGYSQEELFSVLRAKRLMQPHMTNLEQMPLNYLEMCITEFENLKSLLREARAKEQKESAPV